MKKQTKEDLAVDVRLLDQAVDELKSEDSRIRKEFAVAFKWHKKKDYFGNSSATEEVRTPSWEEIFVEVGKLLNVSKEERITSDIESLRFDLQTLVKQVYKEQNG